MTLLSDGKFPSEGPGVPGVTFLTTIPLIIPFLRFGLSDVKYWIKMLHYRTTGKLERVRVNGITIILTITWTVFLCHSE